ncbi:MAG: hypothetical protein U0531_06425 [Dehalococcoidia bacterium]
MTPAITAVEGAALTPETAEPAVNGAATAEPPAALVEEAELPEALAGEPPTVGLLPPSNRNCRCRPTPTPSPSRTSGRRRRYRGPRRALDRLRHGRRRRRSRCRG